MILMMNKYLRWMLALCLMLVMLPAAVLAEGEVAMVNGTKHDTLQKAIDAAGSGDTVTLLANVDMGASSLTVKHKKLTLALNGYHVTGRSTATQNFALINVVGSELVVKGSGEITLTHTGANLQWSASSAVIGINNNNDTSVKGSVIIEDGVTVEHKGGTDMAYAIDLVAYDGCSATVNGGTLKSSYIAVRVFGNHGNKSLTINGGTVQAGNVGVWGQQNGSANVDLTVTDGEIIGGKRGVYVSAESNVTGKADVALEGGLISGGNTSVELKVAAGLPKDTLSATITGGDFDGKVTTNDNEAGSIDITGGMYDEEPAAEYLDQQTIISVANPGEKEKFAIGKTAADGSAVKDGARVKVLEVGQQKNITVNANNVVVENKTKEDVKINNSASLPPQGFVTVTHQAPSYSDVPKTGDTFNIALCMVLLLLSGTAFVALARRTSKQY